MSRLLTAWQVSGYDCTYAAHRGAPSRNEISIPPNASVNLKKNKPRREAPRRNVMEGKHTEAAPALRAADWRGGAVLTVLRGGALFLYWGASLGNATDRDNDRKTW